jgi:hypothetical protein
MKTNNPLLAYCDSIGGLIPVKITGYPFGTSGHVYVRVTATRGAYLAGETLYVPEYRIVSRRTRIANGHIIVSTTNHDAARETLTS